jgi:hypothetical protein
LKIPLSKDLLGSLPAADSQGLTRVKATLRVSAETGEAEVVELNGTPVPSGDEKEGTEDDKNPMPSSSLPNLDAAEQGIYQP